jgi:hypothetical protein
LQETPLTAPIAPQQAGGLIQLDKLIDKGFDLIKLILLFGFTLYSLWLHWLLDLWLSFVFFFVKLLVKVPIVGPKAKAFLNWTVSFSFFAWLHKYKLD